jgi:hypothetical protein
LLLLVDELLHRVVRPGDAGIGVAVEQAGPVVIGLVAPSCEDVSPSLVCGTLRSRYALDPLLSHLAKKALGSLHRLVTSKQDALYLPDVRVEGAQPPIVLLD